ncbi:hypothetical protein OPV22_022354 [Ensete ventricosum]|uniref:Plant heme peroxidase family profile domain-containing protein n=1 Tax=Ensete ventricosum TaxID=4639 RepID=A0AAV8QSP9_ENSVE|nr:hypothetical protein OPV22_022354 [Ensete ventricosum]
MRSTSQGCDASVIATSTGNNTAKKNHPDNKVIKAKAAVDAVAQCRNKVSGADILAIAARDVIPLAGGPSYSVGLGRVDGLRSTAASVTGFNLNQLTSLFVAKGLSQSDMIALSGTVTNSSSIIDQ